MLHKFKQLFSHLSLSKILANQMIYYCSTAQGEMKFIQYVLANLQLAKILYSPFLSFIG